METQDLCPSGLDLEPSDLARFVGGIASHDIRLIVGLNAEALTSRLALDPPSRPILWLDLGGACAASQAIDAALAHLAQALAGLWPYPWGEDFSAVRDDALSHAHLPIRMAALANRLPGLSQTWACAAVSQLARGRAPHVRGASTAVEWAQLALAVSPGGLILATSLDAANTPAGQVRAIEWLAQHAQVAVAVLADRFPDTQETERISYGARHITAASLENLESPMPPAAVRSADAIAPIVLTLPPAPEGQPHPMSPIEQKLHKLIQSDEELRPLFEFNRTISVSLLKARVDLIWLEGRVAVEIDGHEHRGAAKFRADRHRDYELMCAGYRVLRMTNEDVETDAAVALEKIRAVARLARTEAR